VAKVELILFLFLKICISMTYAFLFVSNFVANQLGAFMQHTLVAWANMYFALDGEHAIPFQICS
jgi:uncharacterized membrane protein